MSADIEKVLFISGGKVIGEADALLYPTADPDLLDSAITVPTRREPVSGDCIRRGDGSRWELRSGLSWPGTWMGLVLRVAEPVGKKADKPAKKAVKP